MGVGRLQVIVLSDIHSFVNFDVNTIQPLDGGWLGPAVIVDLNQLSPYGSSTRHSSPDLVGMNKGGGDLSHLYSL